MSISEVTGLPEVEDDEFWRVSPVHDFYSGHLVTLNVKLMWRQRRWWGGTREVELGNNNLIRVSGNSEAENIRDTAQQVLEKHKRQLRMMLNTGDYPPRTLREEK